MRGIASCGGDQEECQLGETARLLHIDHKMKGSGSQAAHLPEISCEVGACSPATCSLKPHQHVLNNFCANAARSKLPRGSCRQAASLLTLSYRSLTTGTVPKTWQLSDSADEDSGAPGRLEQRRQNPGIHPETYAGQMESRC